VVEHWQPHEAALRRYLPPDSEMLITMLSPSSLKQVLKDIIIILLVFRSSTNVDLVCS
jgi:hypothetical protein